MRTEQGKDGTPFLSYYDPIHLLSFVWDGTQDTLDPADPDFGRWIDVSHGGYGEPVVMRIPWVIRIFGDLPSNVTNDTLAAFARTCQAFINLIHVIEDTEHPKEQM